MRQEGEQVRRQEDGERVKVKSESRQVKRARVSETARVSASK